MLELREAAVTWTWKEIAIDAVVFGIVTFIVLLLTVFLFDVPSPWDYVINFSSGTCATGIIGPLARRLIK